MKIGGHELLGAVLERRYRIDAPIARGGMSTVFRGLDTRLDRPVAIKVMDPKFAADPSFLARFEFEARAVARLKHPGLVAVYDQGHDGDLAFLVMELVEGGTLRELLRERGPMPPHAARAVAEPVLDALGVAHAAGLVHRDVKPENVLISDSGEVKIADFGLVRAVAASTTTSSSVILGTAAYLSPEQVSTGTADARSDVYAMGILAFEMLTGRTPFTGDTSLSIAYQRIDNDVPPPSSIIAGIPPELDNFVLRATARDPAQRFVDAAAMASALRAVATALQLPAYRVPAPKRSAEHLSAQHPRRATSAAPTTVEPPRTAVIAQQAPPQRAQPQYAQPHHAPLQHTKVVTTATPREEESPPPPPVSQRGSRYPFPNSVEDRHRSRRKMIIWLVVVLLLALAVGAGGWWMGSGRYTEVPTVEGLDKAAATAAITDADLVAGTRNQLSDTVPVDALIGTDPPSGSRVTRNSTVDLLISLGQPKVPAFNPGETLAAVQQRLRDATLQPVDGGDAFSAKAPIGSVAALDPAPGSAVTVGSSVKVIRSKGAPPVQLPDLRGTSVDDARAKLEGLGISVKNTTTAFDSGVDGGDVIGTDPKAGKTVDAGGDVTLQVSNAVTVPSMLGQSVSSARAELEKLGLKVQVRQVAQTDRSLVITQLPGGGTRVEPGDRVTLISLP
ncbi:Stk1 family PASTA domain-containing Ser/Thr kinase [Antrihabitans cavernicola]|uniref:non-specific serine/threonine protein kinase n=1 Tax=Antrihabitans cavernicola TaxID=2495913 RepID=A0A5A7SFU7_9NOCA|nr:Stk1 family PASTA domain-containing Ser/Thr kinase [Spelaeibacter cavernicola]KAA0023121.1 Stk1 family PASTA domain-containing Ser/Thr kinase [Spelaeibacter cavernicola]